MERGRIVEVGPTAGVFAQTTNERLRVFLDSEK
jgi:ABC-type glutathione transport system ATPase component